MSADAPRALPLKVLAGLSAAVLLAHIVVLKATSMTLGLSQAAPIRAFSTRAIELAPVGQTLAEPLDAQPVAAPTKSTATAPARAARPRPTPPRTSSGTATARPVARMRDAESPGANPINVTQAVNSQVERTGNADQLAAAPGPPHDQASSANAPSLPGSTHLKYKVETNKFPYSLNAELQWQQNGESYEARLELKAFGQTRAQTSSGQITPAGLAPTRFADKYRSEVAAHFDRQKGKVTFSANTPDVALLAGAQDRLSVLVQLAAMIAGDPGRYPQATTIAIQTIGPRAADTWLFTVGSKEVLSLPGGEQATLKLVRNPRQEFDQKVELWLAPTLGYLPARIRITEANGDFVDQKWLATEPRI